MMPPQGKRRRPRATPSWCATARSAVSSNVLLKNMTSANHSARHEAGCSYDPIAGRGKRFGSCRASNTRRHSPGFEAPGKFARVFSCCRSSSASTQRCDMESKRHRKGWWTLAAATCNVNHFNACGTPMSSSRGRCDTSDGYPLDDHPARFIPSRHRPEANSKKSMPRNAERKI